MATNSLINVGDVFSFQGVSIEDLPFDSKNINGQKVISFFPKLNTKVCDFQTLKMLEWSKKFPHITFISISTDPISVAKDWCQAHKVSNLMFVSDLKLKDFASKTGFYLDNKAILKRGLMLIDQDNVIKVLTVNEVLAQDPEYEKISAVLAYQSDF